VTDEPRPRGRAPTTDGLFGCLPETPRAGGRAKGTRGANLADPLHYNEGALTADSPMPENAHRAVADLSDDGMPEGLAVWGQCS
jgi:hypothetical protein